MKIDLSLRRDFIISFAQQIFDKILGLLGRNDDKERTGIQVLVREPRTRNLLFFPVYSPSEAAQFFATEKAIRSYFLSHATSQNSEAPTRMEFAGSLTVYENEDYLQVSTSGLKAEEDVVVSLLLLAAILQEKPIEIRKRIEAEGGILPECFNDETHYLYPLVN